MSLKMFPTAPPRPLAGIKQVIAIAAGKGGVGKSTVTVNLALALHALGYSVGVMDTDVYGPSLRRMLPEDHLPTQKGEVITPALSRGIRMISMAYFRKDNEASAVRAPIANGIITQFIEKVAWGELDFLLIDFPPGTGDIQLTLSQKAHLNGAIMVTTPQEVALMDVRRAMHLFEQVKVPLLGVVENMSYYLHPESKEPLYLFGKGGGERLARGAGIPFLGMIPVDPILSEYGDSGLSIFASPTGHIPIATTFLQLAQQMIEQATLVKEQSVGCLGDFELIWREIR